MTVLTRQNRLPNEHVETNGTEPYLPDFVKIAEAYGAEGARVLKKEDVEPVLRKAFSDDKVWVIEFMVEPEADIEPMIPPGHAIKDLIRKFK